VRRGDHAVGPAVEAMLTELMGKRRRREK